MKTLYLLIIGLSFFSCEINKQALKQKNDIETNEKIQTMEYRKGDTVSYIVPKITYKDTIITTVSTQGTTLKTYYNDEGKIYKSDCIGSEIELLRLEIRSLRDKSVTKEKVKEEKFLNNPLIWLIIFLFIIVILKK